MIKRNVNIHTHIYIVLYIYITIHMKKVLETGVQLTTKTRNYQFCRQQEFFR